MVKFDSQPTLNPEPNVTKFETHDYVADIFFQKNLGSIRPGVFAPTYVKYTPKTFKCFFFFRFFRAPTEKAVGPIFALNTSYNVVLHKDVPFGGENN